MYNIGELIVYGRSGVCRVENIGYPEIPGIKKDKLYYTLVPLYNKGKIFIPVDTENFMRPIISKEKAEELIEMIPSIQEELFYDKNARNIQEYYQNFLDSHDCLDLITLVKILYTKKDIALSNKKNQSQVDLRFMGIAKTLVDEEFSAALEMPIDFVGEYIENKLELMKNNN